MVYETKLTNACSSCMYIKCVKHRYKQLKGNLSRKVNIKLHLNSKRH